MENSTTLFFETVQLKNEDWELVLYMNIDQTLTNKWHGHCKIGVTCVYNGHMFYTLL